MRISRRTSGGRGEYEISGSIPEGIDARDLLASIISVDLGLGWLVNTSVRLVQQGGKLRLRRVAAQMQIQRQLAAALMLPKPVREDVALGVGSPVIQDERYAIEHIEIEHIEVDSVLIIPNSPAILSVSRLFASNLSHHAEEIYLPDRIDQLLHVWKNKQNLPEEISSLLSLHEAGVRNGGPIPPQMENTVSQIEHITAERSADIGVLYNGREDVLPILSAALQYMPNVPVPVLNIQDVDPEDTPLKKRVINEWRRWANARGPASIKFRQNVRSAYNSTCFVCGSHFPSTPFNTNPGVDAAHILPWREYELDEINNGLCLCKIHHWAFDESIINIRHRNGRYIIDVPNEIATSIETYDPQFSLDVLRQNAGIVPVARLPEDRGSWPRPDLLEELIAPR